MMKTLEKVPLSIDDVILKIGEYSTNRDFVLNVTEAGGKHILKIFNPGFPGYLELYVKKSGVVIDGTKGKNLDLNEELMCFIYEVVHGEKTKEERLTYRNVNRVKFEDICQKMISYVEQEKSLYLSRTSKNDYQEIIVDNVNTKEKVRLNYYSIGTLYMFGFNIYLLDELSNIVTQVLDISQKTDFEILNKYVHSANELYMTIDRFECKDCRNLCSGNCSEYLYRLHFGEKIDYSCKRIISYYIPKYSFRYSSEIRKILRLYESILSNFDSINVLSIGCGPATELLGITDIGQKLGKIINYIGIDQNNQWVEVHDFLLDKQSPKLRMKFLYQDMFEVVPQINPNKNRIQSNVIIFQYVISDMLKYYTHEELTSNFEVFKSIVLNYTMKNSMVIFNDINTKAVTTFYDQICINWKDSFHGNKYHFLDLSKPLFPYGKEIQESRIEYSIPDYIEKRYNPWNNCRSAALVLRKVE
jgi:hypothetical protein